MTDTFDFIVIGAGSGGLTAAKFAASLGVSVVLVEKQRVGGDCTWTGCVPSKALLRAARAAHEARNASAYGVSAAPVVVDMVAVHAYVQATIAQIYQSETPEVLEGNGIEVVLGEARFVDPQTIRIGERTLCGKNFLLATGAHPVLPDLPGLLGTPYHTYETLFDNARLPDRMLILGAGPVGLEMAQAYQRLGAQVTVVGDTLLPKDEPEAQHVLRTVLEREGVRFVPGRADRVAYEAGLFTLSVGGESHQADLLLVAVGRAPHVAGLGLDMAGVAFSERGIPVNEHLQTNVRHIYAAGDCTGGYQFTHFAGWQAFQAARNALLVGSAKGFSDVVPWCTFTDPEVAHVGLTEAQAREKHGEAVRTLHRSASQNDRAVCENDLEGFIKIVHLTDGHLLGATIVAARGGEMITEFAIALQHRLKVGDLATTIHAYPTYSTTIQIMASEEAVTEVFSGLGGRLIKKLSGLSDPHPLPTQKENS
jgi:pyruvate/2-oxoglutarate dehydrogenase complex dihydrolipoamide dehydrogenase (E3) component